VETGSLFSRQDHWITRESILLNSYAPQTAKKIQRTSHNPVTKTSHVFVDGRRTYCGLGPLWSRRAIPWGVPHRNHRSEIYHLAAPILDVGSGGRHESAAEARCKYEHRERSSLRWWKLKCTAEPFLRSLVATVDQLWRYERASTATAGLTRCLFGAGVAATWPAVH